MKSRLAAKRKKKIKMERERKIFRIVILDDSEFFNNIFYRQLVEFTKVLGEEKNCDFEVYSFSNTSDFLRNLKEDTDIAFIDYFLGGGVTGFDILNKIRETCQNCKVVIVSHVDTVHLSTLTYEEGIVDFIFKDLHTFVKSCTIIEDFVNSKLSSSQP